MIAIEPQPGPADFLERVASANVEVWPVALSDAPGVVRMETASDARGRDALANVVGPNARDDTRIGWNVEALTVDSLVAAAGIDDLRFVKVDVEGHEMEVLHGATTTLTLQRPVVLVEVEERHRVGALSAVFELFERHRYHGQFLWRGAWHPIEEFDAGRHQNATRVDPKCSKYVNNFLWMPISRSGAGERESSPRTGPPPRG